MRNYKYEDLADRVAAKRYSMVVTLLNRTNSLDLTYDNGTFFNMSIENNSYDIPKALLDYFEKNQLSSYREDSYEYHILKNRMQGILWTAVEGIELSTEMKQVLSPYLNFEDNDSDIANLSDVSADSLDIEEKTTPLENLLTEEKLRILNQKFTSQAAKNNLQNVPKLSVIH